MRKGSRTTGPRNSNRRQSSRISPQTRGNDVRIWNHVGQRDSWNPYPQVLDWIDNGTGNSHYLCFYRVGAKATNFEQPESDKMIEMTVVQLVKTERTSPTQFVPKYEVSLNFSMGNRNFNVVTERQFYPIPRIDFCIKSLGESLIFSIRLLTAAGPQRRRTAWLR